MTAIEKLATCVVLTWSVVGGARAFAVTPEQKCQEQKLKAQGKLEACLKKSAAGVIAGKPDASALCLTKFNTALTKAGTACRYIDNGDGTVTDLHTGLVWEKKDATCPGSHCYTDTFTWCSSTGSGCADSASPPDGTVFSAFLYGLNGGTSPAVNMVTTGCFTSHCDWRLPTVEELAQILDSTAANCSSGTAMGPCIDPIFGPTQGGFYWSDTTLAMNPGALAWGIVFRFGGFWSDEPKYSESTYVRAVRGGL